jgi:hypothetical protein
MSGLTASSEEVADIVSDAWDAHLSDKLVYDELGEPKLEAKDIEWGDDNPGQLKDNVIKLAKMYTKNVLPEVNPTAVEEKVKSDVDGIPCLGYMDAICELGDSTSLVIDHKLGKNRMSQEAADKDLQMSIYATLLDRPIVCAFHQALIQKKLVLNKVLTERGRGDIVWATGLIKEVWNGIQSGIFPPNPLSWTCSESNCSYWTECRVLMDVNTRRVWEGKE